MCGSDMDRFAGPFGPGIIRKALFRVACVKVSPRERHMLHRLAILVQKAEHRLFWVVRTRKIFSVFLSFLVNKKSWGGSSGLKRRSEVPIIASWPQEHPTNFLAWVGAPIWWKSWKSWFCAQEPVLTRSDAYLAFCMSNGPGTVRKASFRVVRVFWAHWSTIWIICWRDMGKKSIVGPYRVAHGAIMDAIPKSEFRTPH